MRAYITLKSLFKVKKDPAVFSIGGFQAFSKDGRGYCFDWTRSFSSTRIDKSGRLIVTVELRDIDERHFTDSNHNILRSELSGDFLASSKLEEVFYECYADQEENEFIPLDITEFQIVDFNGTFNVHWLFPMSELERYAQENAIHLRDFEFTMSFSNNYELKAFNEEQALEKIKDTEWDWEGARVEYYQSNERIMFRAIKKELNDYIDSKDGESGEKMRALTPEQRKIIVNRMLNCDSIREVFDQAMEDYLQEEINGRDSIPAKRFSIHGDGNFLGQAMLNSHQHYIIDSSKRGGIKVEYSIELITGEKIDIGKIDAVFEVPSTEAPRITQDQADKIIQTRIPQGKFYAWGEDKGKYTAIDNSTGEAWVEEFGSVRDCLKYLNGEEVKE